MPPYCEKHERFYNTISATAFCEECFREERRNREELQAKAEKIAAMRDACAQVRGYMPNIQECLAMIDALEGQE